MSDTPPHPPSEPMSGFTVDPRALPPASARPATVTAASWMLLAAMVLALAVAVFTFINMANQLSSGSYAVTPTVLAPLFAIASVVLMPFIRGGFDGARVTAFALFGALTMYGLLTAVRTILAAVVYDGPYESPLDGGTIIATLIPLVLGAFGAVTMALLMGTKASVWFHERRASRRPRASAPPYQRPATSIVVAVLLGTLVLTTILYFVVAVVLAAPGSRMSYLLPTGVADLITIVVVTAAAVMVGIGSDVGRHVSVGLGGFFIGSTIFTFISFVYVALRFPEYVNMYQLISLSISVVQGVIGVGVILMLSGRTTADWYHHRRVGVPAPPPPQQLSTPPTGPNRIP